MKHTDSIYYFLVEKNRQLIRERNISFEEVIAALYYGKLLDTIDHHNREKYPHQKIYVVEISGYVYSVPFVRKEKHQVFLKTIIPSRDLTKKYLK